MLFLAEKKMFFEIVPLSSCCPSFTARSTHFSLFKGRGEILRRVALLCCLPWHIYIQYTQEQHGNGDLMACKEDDLEICYFSELACLPHFCRFLIDCILAVIFLSRCSTQNKSLQITVSTGRTDHMGSIVVHSTNCCFPVLT